MATTVDQLQQSVADLVSPAQSAPQQLFEEPMDTVAGQPPYEGYQTPHWDNEGYYVYYNEEGFAYYYDEANVAQWRYPQLEAEEIQQEEDYGNDSNLDNHHESDYEDGLGKHFDRQAEIEEPAMSVESENVVMQDDMRS
jgi:hypothetical protein